MGFRFLCLAAVGVASCGSVLAFRTVLAPDGVTYRAVDCHTVASSVSTPLSCECDGNVVSNNSGCKYNSLNAFLVYFWMASAVWSLAVGVNVVAATVADSVTTWWSSPGDVRTAWVSFRLVIQSSLG